jgi:hypothetical protein
MLYPLSYGRRNRTRIADPRTGAESEAPGRPDGTVTWATPLGTIQYDDA